MGLLTQPISCIGLPVVRGADSGTAERCRSACRSSRAPWREDLCFRVAASRSVACRRRVRDAYRSIRRAMPCRCSTSTDPRSWPKCAPRSSATKRALVGNDVAVLDELFWHSPQHAALRRHREPVWLRCDRARFVRRVPRPAWRVRSRKVGDHDLRHRLRAPPTWNFSAPAAIASAARARPGCACPKAGASWPRT